MTTKQVAFIEAYFGPAKLNATAAARIVGYAWPNKQGPTLLHHPVVGVEVERRFQALLDCRSR